MSLFQSLLDLLSRLFTSGAPAPRTPRNDALETITPRVLAINFDPVVDAQGTRLTKKMGWKRVDDLIAGFIADMEEVSHGLVKYRYDPANRIDVDTFPHKTDGFQYTSTAYLNMMQDEKTHHEPDGVDYWRIVRDYGLIEKVTANEIDEVWLFGGPYFGFWESHMVGKGAIWCNSSPLANSESCARRFVIMGFNYQRGVGEMLHDIGHRMESIVAHVYNASNALHNAYRAVDPRIQPPIGPEHFANPKNDFERFMLFEKIAPGSAGVGLVHMPPNADKDYDWRNTNPALSTCDCWLNYPDLQGTPRSITCDEWGQQAGGDGHIKWWLKRIPHAPGSKNGILNNWWRYTMQVDQPFR
ncbi:MAG: hypothetical protein ACOYYS_19685 [Chloroflexota bacterium]